MDLATWLSQLDEKQIIACMQRLILTLQTMQISKRTVNVVVMRYSCSLVQILEGKLAKHNLEVMNRHQNFFGSNDKMKHSIVQNPPSIELSATAGYGSELGMGKKYNIFISIIVSSFFCLFIIKNCNNHTMQSNHKNRLINDLFSGVYNV